MSRFTLSVLLFLIVNLLAAKILVKFGQDYSCAQGPHQELTWTEWALADFEKQRNKPAPIVILGSSLVLTPINLADAKISNCTINGALHHKSDMLNNLLIEHGENAASNFNFALPGLMPSDAYLITKLLLSNKEQHKLIIYGVGPRDFVDNLLASPASTDPYRCLSKSLNQPKDQQTKLSFIGKNWQSQIDYFLSCSIPVYRDREKIISMLCEKGRCFVSPIIAAFGLKNKSVYKNWTIADVHNLLPDYNPMSIGVNQALFFPNPQIDPNRFAQNLNEYRSRYGRVNWDTFTCQTQFFADFLKLARSNGDRVLIIAMPITSVNRELLPDYVSAAYKQNLNVLTKIYGADFIDLDNSGLFNDEDFGDTVHLSTTGSIKLLRSIADYIEQARLLEGTNGERRRLANAGVKI